MEHDDRHLDSLSSSVVDYFNGVLIREYCVSANFWKSNVKNDERVEFSFPLLRSNCGENQSFNQINLFSLTEEGLKITSDDLGLVDLTAYRLHCIKTSAVKLLHFAGYLANEEGELSLCFTTKSGSQNPGQIRILCGPVINSSTRNKETEITFEEYRKLLLKDMKDTCGDKNSEKTLLESLVDTIIRTSFLQVNACQGVSLNFDVNPDGPQHRGNKGGVFLQYTSSRLSTIRKKYEEQVVAGIYPKLPEVENVDFSILKEPEEWNLLFNFLLEYPSMIDTIAKDMISGKSKLHLVCNFLSKLCSLFSVYYRKIRILLEPRDHLIPLIQARLLLAMSVEQILDNGLAILNICKIEHM